MITGLLLSILVVFAGITVPPAQAATWPDELEHIIVLYLENWSFDGLFGTLKGVDGLSSTAATSALSQTDRENVVYTTLPQDNNHIIPVNTPNKIVDFEAIVNAYQGPLPPSDITHRYFHEQYQFNDGKMDQYVAWSNAKGIAYSYFDISQQYFGQLAQNYTILDRFFHSAFGGSMLNHQWLVTAQTPKYPAEILENNATLYNLMVATFNATTGIVDRDNPIFHNLTDNIYWAVNHLESENPPLNPRTNPLTRLPSQNHTTIGDKLSEVGVSWRWYSGGYNLAMNGTADKYQYHHQPFVFFDRFKDPNSWDRREHIQDEENLFNDLKQGNLPKISWWKPYGLYNFHPGAANQNLVDSQKKLEEIVSAIQNSAYWEKCAIIITFDENGGRWDHVVPPKGDNWGPGTRIPATVVSPLVKKGYVDSRQFETLSVVKFIEEFAGTNGTLISSARYPLVTSLAQLFVTTDEPLALSPTAKEGLILGIVIPTSILLIILVGGIIFIKFFRKKGTNGVEVVDSEKTMMNEDQQTFYAATDYTAFTDTDTAAGIGHHVDT